MKPLAWWGECEGCALPGRVLFNGLCGWCAGLFTRARGFVPHPTAQGQRASCAEPCAQVEPPITADGTLGGFEHGAD